ncbi:MFS transporter [Millisia brevis]|uniref:MFS transporter n=1 Tax=Millisia brevis TaxID=264148 RepID=UPI00082BAB95|nr:MFS transporter [Millisia brevis]
MSDLDTPDAEHSNRAADERDLVRHRRKQIVAGVFGHMVEWFDWAVYSYLAIFFAHAFFPDDTGSDLLPLIGTFGVFAIGFLARPFGGMILGAYGDRHGRRAALTLSISMMGLGSLAIAVMPTYDQIGLLAPLLLTVARLVQGISTGGEWGAAASFISESAPDARRGLYGSLLYVGSNAGKVLLSVLGALLLGMIGNDGMESYGWRILFFLGAVLALAGWYIRRNAIETADIVLDTNEKRSRPGVFDSLRQYPRATLTLIGFTVGPAVVTYTLTAYLPTLAVTDHGLDKGDSLRAIMITLILFLIAQPIAGALSDRWGRKPVIGISALSFVVGGPFLLSAIDGTFLNLVIVQGLALVMLSGATAVSGSLMAELFPARIRVSGIALPYSIAVAVFGGTAPLLATSLQSIGWVNVFGWYVSVVSLVSFLTVLTLRETARKPLP